MRLSKTSPLAYILVSVMLVVSSFGACAELAEPSSHRTKALAEWESLKYGMFICFGMSTYTGN